MKQKFQNVFLLLIAIFVIGGAHNLSYDKNKPICDDPPKPQPSVNKKPAIYLYHTTPTKVNINFSEPIKLIIDVPKYSNKGWNVLAKPNGELQDLQPELTDCNKLKSCSFGLEYAYSACKNNSYPYIYWEGSILTKKTPSKNEGWIVNSKDLNQFLSKKLDEIKFNQSEKKEFINYWVPYLTNKSKYYFIYFVQNEEVDKYVPLNVNPKPDSMNRIYMISQPLDKKPTTNVKPQKLQKISRKGFTLLEWGGEIK